MAPQLSLVVVVHDMDREFPRTLATLQPSYQRDIKSADYEIIVVDNGSREPLPPTLLEQFSGTLRSIRVDDASPSPARAANMGLGMAEGDFVGLVIDGARMASPGLLSTAVAARALADWPVVATLAWHLGSARHMQADETGYDQAAEDALLETVPWMTDGYSLFTISTLAGSSARGWFGPLGESSALFMHRATWSELGGLDEAFALPGGGFVNHDLYRRACGLPATRLVVLLGEGTFHQHHGGAATSGAVDPEAMRADYERLRGQPYKPPGVSPTYLGEMSEAVLPHVVESARLAMERSARARAQRQQRKA